MVILKEVLSVKHKTNAYFGSILDLNSSSTLLRLNMSGAAVFSNRVTKLFNIRYPIIQGGMVWTSGWRLASAVRYLTQNCSSNRVCVTLLTRMLFS